MNLQIVYIYIMYIYYMYVPQIMSGQVEIISFWYYRVLADLFPASGIVRDTVVDNRRHWEKICALIKIRRGGSCEQMSYDQILAMEEEEANAEIENYNLQNQKQNGRWHLYWPKISAKSSQKERDSAPYM